MKSRSEMGCVERGSHCLELEGSSTRHSTFPVAYEMRLRRTTVGRIFSSSYVGDLLHFLAVDQPLENHANIDLLRSQLSDHANTPKSPDQRRPFNVPTVDQDVL